jgi:hypothetical protein
MGCGLLVDRPATTTVALPHRHSANAAIRTAHAGASSGVSAMWVMGGLGGGERCLRGGGRGGGPGGGV